MSFSLWNEDAIYRTIIIMSIMNDHLVFFISSFFFSANDAPVELFCSLKTTYIFSFKSLNNSFNSLILELFSPLFFLTFWTVSWSLIRQSRSSSLVISFIMSSVNPIKVSYYSDFHKWLEYKYFSKIIAK